MTGAPQRARLAWSAPVATEIIDAEEIARIRVQAATEEVSVPTYNVVSIVTGEAVWPSQVAKGTRGGAAAPVAMSTRDDKDDPLARMTPWQIFQRCIYLSDEDSDTRLTLLCISRFMDKNLRAASMSFASIARACGFSESTAKRCAKRARDRWLRIGVQKGRYVPGKGNENLYHGMIPGQYKEKLRRLLLGGRDVEPDDDLQKVADEAVARADGDDPAKGEPEVAQDAKLAFTLYASMAARCGLPVPEMADPWLPKIGKTLRDSGGLGAWRRMLAEVEASPFLRGDANATWRADLDWLLRPLSYQKVLSGKYRPMRRATGVGANPTFDEDLQKLVASPTGRKTLAKEGPEKGMETLRKDVADHRRRMGRG